MHETQQGLRVIYKTPWQVPGSLEVANRHIYFSSAEEEIQPFSDHCLKYLKTGLSGTNNNIEAFVGSVMSSLKLPEISSGKLEIYAKPCNVLLNGYQKS